MTTDIFNTRILVVEDEHFMRMLIVEALNSVGFGAIREASNGEEALELLLAGEIDLVFTDIEMKPVDGFDLVRALRSGATAQRRDTPVVFLTGFSDVGILSSAARLDVQGFLVKPVSANQLRGKVRQALAAAVELKPCAYYETLDFSAGGAPQSAAATRPPRTQRHPGGSEDPAPLPGTHRVDVLMLSAGMVLREDVYVHGRLLLKDGSTLGAPHVSVLQDMRTLLERRDLLVDR